MGVELNISDEKKSVDFVIELELWDTEKELLMTDKFASLRDWIHFDTSK